MNDSLGESGDDLESLIREAIRESEEEERRLAAAARRKVLVEDLPVSVLSRIEERMRPGGYSEEGFLNPTQSLVSVVERDARTLGDLSVGYDAVADRLEELISKAAESSPRLKPVVVEGHLKIFRDARHFGMQECPFIDASGGPLRCVSIR